MPSLLEALPLLEGWTYKTVHYSAREGQPYIPVAPGAEKVLIEDGGSGQASSTTRMRGYLLSASVQVTTHLAKMRLVVRGKVGATELDRSLSSIDLLIPDFSKPGNNQSYVSNPQMLVDSGGAFLSSIHGPLVAPDNKPVAIWPSYPITLHAPASNPGKVYIGNGRSTDASVGAITDTFFQTTFSAALSPGDALTLKDVGLLSHIFASADDGPGGIAVNKLEWAHEIPDMISNFAPGVANSTFIPGPNGINFAPNYPIGFGEGFLLSVRNPETYPLVYIPGITGGAPNPYTAYIWGYDAAFIKIDDPTAFVESLKCLEK